MSTTSASPQIGRDQVTRVIFEYAGKIGFEQDREALLALIADMGRDLVNADRCSIWLIEDKELVTRVAHGTRVIRLPIHQGLVGQCATTGEIVLSNSAGQHPSFASAVDGSTGYHTESVLLVPMRSASGEVMGAFQALNKPGGFAPLDADLLSLAAGYSARVIETQRLLLAAEDERRLRQELAIARDVQQRLLPPDRINVLDGVDVVGICRSAAEVGGDYYSFIQLSHGELALAVGDIAGKGIAAALMMASVQASIHALTPEGYKEPCELIAQLNRIVHESTGASRYSTLFFAHYDRDKQLLHSVNAGHEYPLLVTASGEIIALDAGGFPLGCFPDASYPQQESPFRPGDTLVCYSDGVSEAHNAQGEILSQTVFLEMVAQSKHLPVREMAVQIIALVDEFAAGAKQHDDMTIVCVRAKS